MSGAGATLPICFNVIMGKFKTHNTKQMKLKQLIYFISMVMVVPLSATAPNWQVNRGDYFGTMTIVCTSEVDGMNIGNVNSKIGVFKDGVCRGVANAIYHPVFKKYCFYLSVSGNTQPEELSLRVYEIIEKVNYIYNGTAGLVNPIVYPAAFCREDYLLTAFESSLQVINSEIVGDSIIKLYHDQNNDITSTVVRYSSLLNKGILKNSSQQIIESGRSELNLNEQNVLDLYTPDGFFVQSYRVEVHFAFATPTLDVKVQDEPIIRKCGGSIHLTPQNNAAKTTLRVWTMNGRFLAQKSSFTNEPFQVPIASNVHYLVYEVITQNKQG